MLDSAIVRNWLKRAAKEQLTVNPRALAIETMNMAKPTTAAVLPTQQNLARVVRRSRGTQGLAIPNSLAELHLPDIYKTTHGGESFVLFDKSLYDDNNDRLIIFATAENLKLLSECDSIYADGTFDLAPPMFQQLYSILGKKTIEILLSIFIYINELSCSLF